MLSGGIDFQRSDRTLANLDKLLEAEQRYIQVKPSGVRYLRVRNAENLGLWRDLETVRSLGGTVLMAYPEAASSGVQSGDRIVSGCCTGALGYRARP